ADRVRPVAQGREVVVLDEDAIGEADAVVVPAALADGVLLQEPPAGGGLARVEDLAAAAGDIDVAARQRGDAAEPLQEVQGRALRGQDRAHRPGERGQAGAGRDGGAVGDRRRDGDVRIDRLEHEGGDRQPGDDAGGAGD